MSNNNNDIEIQSSEDADNISEGFGNNSNNNEIASGSSSTVDVTNRVPPPPPPTSTVVNSIRGNIVNYNLYDTDHQKLLTFINFIGDQKFFIYSGDESIFKLECYNRIIPEGAKELYIGNIKQEFIVGSIITGAFGSIISTNTTHTINNVTHPIGTLEECVHQLPLTNTEREHLIKKIPRLAITGTSLLLNSCMTCTFLPNTVTTVTFGDGFNQKLTKGMIPEGVKDLRLGNIKQELIIDSIPNKSGIPNCIIPEGVKELYIGNIKQELIIGSIPNSVTIVILCNGFNQKLTKGIIPKGVKELRLGDIKEELIIGSIPNTISTVRIIPEGVKELRLGDIKKELIIGSIPNTVTTVRINDGFNQKLTKVLYIGNVKQEIIIGSIPNTVTTVILWRGFNQKLTKGIISERVKELYLGDIRKELIID
ncbi:hypothetical protein ACTFIY_001436 [Dictyostelium cf. discoideum]